MEERVVKLCASVSMLLMLLVCSAFFYLPQLHVYEERVREEYRKEAMLRDQLSDMTGLELLQYNTITSERADGIQEFREQLRMQLLAGVDEKSVAIGDDYLNQTITVSIPGADADYMFRYPMVGDPDHIVSLTYESVNGNGYLDIQTDQVFEYESRIEDGYLYLDFVDPHRLYDKVVVIDAGHGGNMPGATRGEIYEKDIDLAITEELFRLFAEPGNENIRVYFTRLDDSNPSFEQRVELANKANADVFISIHNNTSPSRSSTTGTTVLYAESEQGEPKGSRRLAEICEEEVTAALGSKDQGLTDGNEIYILRNATVPAALVEVGFMSNKEELYKLTTQEYQHAAAVGIYNAIHKAFEEGF